MKHRLRLGLLMSMPSRKCNDGYFEMSLRRNLTVESLFEFEFLEDG